MYTFLFYFISTSLAAIPASLKGGDSVTGLVPLRLSPRDNPLYIVGPAARNLHYFSMLRILV
jgi:hypothetical protein